MFLVLLGGRGSLDGGTTIETVGEVVVICETFEIIKVQTSKEIRFEFDQDFCLPSNNTRGHLKNFER
jgi:hypothetical protein